MRFPALEPRGIAVCALGAIPVAVMHVVSDMAGWHGFGKPFYTTPASEAIRKFPIWWLIWFLVLCVWAKSGRLTERMRRIKWKEPDFLTHCLRLIVGCTVVFFFATWLGFGNGPILPTRVVGDPVPLRVALSQVPGALLFYTIAIAVMSGVYALAAWVRLKLKHPSN